MHAPYTDRERPVGRVLMVTSNYPRWRGDSTTPFVHHLALELQKTGWRVDVLAPHAPGASRAEVMDGINVHRFRYLWPTSLQTVCYGGGALINLQRKRSNILKLPLLVFFELLAVMGALRKNRYDILHSHWILPQGFVCSLAARTFRTPHVLSIHGSDLSALRGAVLAAFKRFALNRADVVTVNSSFTESGARGLTSRYRRLVRIPTPANVRPIIDEGKRLDVQGKYRRGGGPLCCFAGRIVEEKGVEDFIRAFPFIFQKYPDATGIVMGAGQDLDRMKALAASLSLDEKVSFLGWVESSLVQTYMSACDVFIGPSRTTPDGRTEALGLAFIEALAAGVPVVAARLGGITDIIEHEETGLLVPERSPGQIARMVDRLMHDQVLRARIVEQGKARALSEFDGTVSAGRFAGEYQRLMGSSPA